MAAAAEGKPPAAAHASSAQALHASLQAACAEGLTRLGAFASVASAPAGTLERCSPAALLRLKELLGVNAAPDFGTLANDLKYQDAMMQLGDDCFAVPSEISRVGIVYYLSISLPAHAWASEIQRLDTGDFTSRLRADKLVPPSYVGMLHALRRVVQHHCRAGGDAETLVSVFYIGMSDAADPLWRLLSHGTSSGCPAIHQVYSRTAPMKARAFHGVTPVVRRRIIAFTLPAMLQSCGSPAASLEALVGAACLALQPLRPCGGTSPHGDEALLFHDRLRPGRPAMAPLALSFLHSSVLALRSEWALALPAAEPQELMRAHVLLAAELLQRARQSAAEDCVVTLRDAWCALLGKSAVSLVLASARRSAAGAADAHSSPGGGVNPGDPPPEPSAEVEGGGHVSNGDDGASCSSSSGGSGSLPAADSSVMAFRARAHLSDEALRSLQSSFQPAASASRELLAAMGLPQRLTPGAVRVTELDIEHWRDAARRRERGGVPVDEHLLNVLLGELQDLQWAHTEASMDAQGTILSLRAVICSTQQREAYSSHPHMRLIRVMDATFGVAGSEYEFFVIIHIHPPTLMSLPLAFFLRKRGRKEDPQAAGQQISDLAWCERTMQSRFGLHPAAVTFVDKCASSLASWVQSLKESWAAAALVPALSPASAVSSGKPSLAALQRLLAHVAEGCTAAEEESWAEYLARHVPALVGCPTGGSNVADSGAAVESSEASGAAIDGSDHASGTADAARLPAPFAEELFGLWGATHPHLVRPLAARIMLELQAAVSAVAEADGLVAADAALARLGALAVFVADAGSALSLAFRDLVERAIRLCLFHAQKAMLEHSTRHQTLPPATIARWSEDVKPAIEKLFSASAEELPAAWDSFCDEYRTDCPKFVAYMEDNWMAGKWRTLWTGAGRYHIARFLIDTSNYAEIFFRVAKRDLLRNKMPSDPVVFLELLIGLPTKPSSIQQSYVMSKLLNISDIMSGITNMTRPPRQRMDQMRDDVADILACDGAIVPVSAYEYDVATRSARISLRAGVSGISSRHRVSLLHGCPCRARAAHCSQVLACRAWHLKLGRRRCWRDAELAAIVPLEMPSSLRTAPQLLAIEAPTQPEHTAESANTAHAAQVAAVQPLATSVAEALEGFAAQPSPAPLLPSATEHEIAARVQNTARLARTHRALSALSAVLDGQPRTAMGGRWSLPASARSPAEIDARRRTAPLQYRGGGAGGTVAPAVRPAAHELSTADASAAAAAPAAATAAAAAPTAASAAAAAPSTASAARRRGRSSDASRTPNGGAVRQRRRHTASPAAHDAAAPALEAESGARAARATVTAPSPAASSSMPGAHVSARSALDAVHERMAAFALQAYYGARDVHTSIRWANRDAPHQSTQAAVATAEQHVNAMRTAAAGSGHVGPW